MGATLIQIDGKLPNLALMRLAAHYEGEVEFTTSVEFGLFEPKYEDVYASTIFSKSRGLVDRLLEQVPWAVVGGTGSGSDLNLEDIGVGDCLDYSIYPEYQFSIGYSQRGCRFRCPFCVVPQKEGRIRSVSTIGSIWRGDPYPKSVVLLDNDFFGQTDWRDRARELIDGNFRVSLTQGINVRCITDEQAEVLSLLSCYDSDFKFRAIYTAWDSIKDESRFVDGIKRLARYGINPGWIMVYMLCGFHPWEDENDREHRRKVIRDLGCHPYPMPFTRTQELVGFQRWVVGNYDRRIPWSEWKKAQYRPERLNAPIAPGSFHDQWITEKL